MAPAGLSPGRRQRAAPAWPAWSGAAGRRAQPGAGCWGCGSGCRSTVASLMRARGRAAAGRYARSCRWAGERAGEPRMRVVIADDQALVRGGFRLMLTAGGFEVGAEAADGAQAVTAGRRHRPDVVLMDIRMPELDGIEATRRILAAGPALAGVRILILTTFDLDQYVYAALAAGASGFLLKDVTPEH